MWDGSPTQTLGATPPDGQQFVSGCGAAASLHTFKPFPQRLNHRQGFGVRALGSGLAFR